LRGSQLDVSHSSNTVAFFLNRKNVVSATVAILWLSFPIEVKVVTAGARKLYLSFEKMFSFEVKADSQQIESEKSSLV